MPELVICGFKTHVEIPILLMFYAFAVSDSVKTNLIIYRTCYVLLGYSEERCALLGGKSQDFNTTSLERIVEPHANTILMTSSLIAAFLTAIICFFVGPWSDRFGRKLVLIIPLLGTCLAFVILSIFAALPWISPWYAMLNIIPFILSGGFSSYMAVVFSYVSDVTLQANRGIRMAIVEGAIGFGVFLGHLSSSYLLNYLGYSFVFLIASICCLLAAVYTIFFVTESIRRTDLSENSFRSLIHIYNVSEMLRTTFKRRPHYNRAIVLSSIIMLTLFVVVLTGEGAVLFLYLREKLRFSLQKYSLYSAGYNVTWIFGTSLCVYILHKLLKIRESILILIGFLSLAINTVLQAIAVEDWHIFIGVSIRFFGAMISPMIRSLVTKVVPNEDIGKIFTVIVTSESLFGLMGGPAYTQLYNATLYSDSSIFNYVTVGIFGFCIFLITGVILVDRTRIRNPCITAEADRNVPCLGDENEPYQSGTEKCPTDQAETSHDDEAGPSRKIEAETSQKDKTVSPLVNGTDKSQDNSSDD